MDSRYRGNLDAAVGCRSELLRTELALPPLAAGSGVGAIPRKAQADFGDVSPCQDRSPSRAVYAQDRSTIQPARPNHRC